MIIDLPWKGRDTPCAILDILRGCNASCAFCYNTEHAAIKPLASIKSEIEELVRLRRLQALMVSGGEPLLHPDVFEILRAVREKGLVPILLTNGILLDDAVAEKLSAAGCELCYLHIQAGQQRCDLRTNADRADAAALLREKCGVLLRNGIRAGCCFTLPADDENAIGDTCRTYFEIEGLSNLLITTARSAEDFDRPYCDDMPIDALLARFRRIGLVPFASLSGKIDKRTRRWFSFQVVEALGSGGSVVSRICLRASHGEKLAMKLLRMRKGHYDFTLPPASSAMLRARLVLNAVTGGRFFEALRLALNPSVALRFRNLALDVPPYRRRDGRIEHCEDCPGAILKNGRLRPLCLSDIELDETDSNQ